MASAKITLKQIRVIKDGDSLDKGELYYWFCANEQQIIKFDRKDFKKVTDGETIFSNETIQVNNLRRNNPLVVTGYANEKDGLFSQEEKARCNIVFEEKENFGQGNRTVVVQDGNNFKVFFDFNITLL